MRRFTHKNCPNWKGSVQYGYRELRHLPICAKSTRTSYPSHFIPFNLRAGVIGVADLLLQSNPSEDQRMLLETIRTSGESLLQILCDILDLSKIENEKMTLEYSDWDLRTHLEESLSVFRIRAQEKGLEVREGERGRSSHAEYGLRVHALWKEEHGTHSQGGSSFGGIVLDACQIAFLKFCHIPLASCPLYLSLSPPPYPPPACWLLFPILLCPSLSLSFLPRRP